MKVIIKKPNGEKRETVLSSIFQVFVIGILDQDFEIPALTNFYRKKFEEEAKQQEFESFVKH